MLQDYINDYCEAFLKKDKQEMRQIEGILFRLGMDRATMLYLVKTELMERISHDTETSH